jgi:hypothetical protein
MPGAEYLTPEVLRALRDAMAYACAAVYAASRTELQGFLKSLNPPPKRAVPGRPRPVMFAASFDFRERPDRKTVGTQIRAALTGQPSRLGRHVRGDPLAPRDHPNRGPPLKRERVNPK